MRQGLFDISNGPVDCMPKWMRTVVHGAHMVAHGRNLDIVATVGAFDGGQEAHVHSRHSRVNVRGSAGGSSRGVSVGKLPRVHHHELPGGVVVFRKE